MADVALDRADGALLAGAVVPKGLGQRGDLDRVAQHGAGAVGLDIADFVRFDAGHGQGSPDDGRLSLDAGRREADLVGAIAVDRRAADDGMDAVSIADGILEALEHDHARPAAQHRARCLGIEGATMPVTRQDGPVAIEIATALEQIERHPARQRHVAFLGEQRLAGHVHRHQRGRAGRLHGDGRPLQVELVSDARGHRIGPVAPDHGQDIENGAARGQRALRQQMADQVGRRAASPENTDGVAVLRPPAQIAGMLQRVPGGFQKETLLRVEQLGITGRETEQGRVETVHALS